MHFSVSPSPAPALCLHSLSLPSFSFLLLTHHSPSLSCSLPLQLSLLSKAGAAPLILPAAAWWRTVTDRVALPLYPAALKQRYIHLQGLITTWHVPHLQQTLSWQQSTKRSIGCTLINKWNKYHCTYKNIGVKTPYINSIFPSLGTQNEIKGDILQQWARTHELKAWFK